MNAWAWVLERRGERKLIVVHNTTVVEGLINASGTMNARTIPCVNADEALEVAGELTNMYAETSDARGWKEVSEPVELDAARLYTDDGSLDSIAVYAQLHYWAGGLNSDANLFWTLCAKKPGNLGDRLILAVHGDSAYFGCPHKGKPGYDITIHTFGTEPDAFDKAVKITRSFVADGDWVPFDLPTAFNPEKYRRTWRRSSFDMAKLCDYVFPNGKR